MPMMKFRDLYRKTETGLIPSEHWLVAIVYVISAVAFVFDLLRVTTLAFGIIYAPMIATALMYKSRNAVWVLCAIAGLAVFVGAFFPFIPADDELYDLVGNRVLSFIAIGTTAAFVFRSRQWQERLQAATDRAEHAERLKSEVLQQLSREIQTPLHTLLGILTLAMSSGKPDRDTSARILSDGKHLLATIDDLVDLARLDDRVLQTDAVDLARVARDAAKSAADAARARQIKIELDIDGRRNGMIALCDAWAVKRIVDNLLSNAIRLAPAGTAVTVLLRESAGRIIASVSDAGHGLPLPIALELDENALPTDGDVLRLHGATGLALSNRLANAMNGRLTARNQPGSGAVVSLSVPSAAPSGGD